LPAASLELATESRHLGAGWGISTCGARSTFQLSQSGTSFRGTGSLPLPRRIHLAAQSFPAGLSGVTPTVEDDGAPSEAGSMETFERRALETFRVTLLDTLAPFEPFEMIPL